MQDATGDDWGHSVAGGAGALAGISSGAEPALGALLGHALLHHHDGAFFRRDAFVIAPMLPFFRAGADASKMLLLFLPAFRLPTHRAPPTRTGLRSLVW